MTRRALATAALAGLAVSAVLAAVLAATVAAMSQLTESDIEDLREAAAREASARPPAWPAAAALDALPPPVRRWVAYTFPEGPALCVMADVGMQGRFRRPRSEGFAPTSARQRIAGGTPTLVFDATTTVRWPLWARAWDGYVGGRMTMKARILSAITVVDESSTPALDRTSLRRWLLEGAACPNALLPGGPVRWEPVDDEHARAVVRHGGLEAALRATFDAEGRLLQFDAEEDGDLALPYHGSGERVERGDFRLVQGVRVPHRFVVSRVAGGRVLPFWDGEVTLLRLQLATAPR